MEDWHMLAADCIVISCCCQCLVLQLLVFILFKLPSKLIRKAKQYVKTRFRDRKLAGRRRMGRYAEEFKKRHSRRWIGGESYDEIHDCGCCCMEEVENVLEAMSRKGEFGFGSFWRGEDSDYRFPVCFRNYDLIEIVGSYRYR